MRTFISAFFLAFIATASLAQNGAEYFAGMGLRAGIYADFAAFRYNAPTVPLDRLRDAQGLPVADIRRVSGKLQWQPDSGAIQTVDLRTIWAFCQNDVVYLGPTNGFYRIGLMGSWSHLIVEQTYRDWDPYMYGYPMGGVTRTVLVQQLLDMRTGRYLPFNASGMDEAPSTRPRAFRGVPRVGQEAAQQHRGPVPLPADVQRPGPLDIPTVRNTGAGARESASFR